MMRNFKGQVARDMGIGNGLNSHLAKRVRGLFIKSIMTLAFCPLPLYPYVMNYQIIVKIFI